MEELSEKDLSNIAQFVAATEGDVLTRVIFYLALNTRNTDKEGEPREFVKSNREIAKAVGSDKDTVSRKIQKLKKMKIIGVWYANMGFETQRTITWIGKKVWKDIRDYWKTNKSTVDENVYGVSTKKSTSNRQNGLGNNKDTYIDTSFDTEQKKSRKEIKSKHLNKLKGGK